MDVFDHHRLARLGSAAREAGPASQLGSARGSPAQGAIARSAWLGIRVFGGLAVLAVGAVHLQQYYKLYSAIPTIGTLFVLNFAGATAIGLGLLAPIERALGRRLGGAVLGLLALAGIGLAITAFVFLIVAEHRPLFGFMEPDYDPTAILASRVAEVAAALLLGSYLVGRFAVRVRMARW